MREGWRNEGGWMMRWRERARERASEHQQREGKYMTVEMQRIRLFE